MNTDIVRKLYHTAGPEEDYDQWWPGDSPWAIAVTAVLTQFTRWERAWSAWLELVHAHCHTPEQIARIPLTTLESLIRPAGTFRRKARTLQMLADRVIQDLAGEIQNLSRLPLNRARAFLTDIPGIGPETADSILLYACHIPVFIIDAYTRRILTYHGWATKPNDFKHFQKCVELTFGDASRLARFHAMFVMIGKQYCRKNRPICTSCPWSDLLPSNGPTLIPSRSSKNGDR